jgi:hypothetical protein
MKTFRYELGHVAASTMTVAELRAKLDEYPGEMPVFGGWEGVLGPMNPAMFDVRMVDYGQVEDAAQSLVIDVDNSR